MGRIPLFGKEGIGEIFRTSVFSIMDSLVNHKKIWKETSPTSPPLRGCVAIGEMEKNVMLNLFQHLMESISYETLKRVQGDKE